MTVVNKSERARVGAKGIITATILGLAALCPVAAQSVREAQVRAAQATDVRILQAVAQFRAAVVEKWGDQLRLGGLEISESEVKATGEPFDLQAEMAKIKARRQ